jgi:hypothetical protein
MPCFNTHWLVAMKCIKDTSPKSIIDGFEKYKKVTLTFKAKIDGQINAVFDKATYDAFLKSALDDELKEYNKQLTKSANYDDITCFSAYMLGACGPDFWTVPSLSEGALDPTPDTAGVHFDLGHYNRTHRQFQMAIKRWEDKKDLSPLQVKVEQAYFYGMATHIATDCVMHQLVNVSAGAYQLLMKKHWKNEQGTLSFKLWNTHNKVENFWDSYIRYRYLGDVADLFSQEPAKSEKDKDNGMIVIGFPTVEKIIARLAKEKNVFKQSLGPILQEPANRIKIEKSFVLPRIFCDRVANGGIKPFLHSIVVDKETGAYPGRISDSRLLRSNVLEGIVFESAIKEATSFQMKAGTGGHSEGKKLSFFGSASNSQLGPLSFPMNRFEKGIVFNTNSFNYLNYTICPDMAKVRQFGWNVFYHTKALDFFFDSAVKAGVEFSKCLNKGIVKNNPKEIGNLGKFWNLDTGLGLEVKSHLSDTPYEVITELNFIHINTLKAIPRVNYSETYIALAGTTALVDYPDESAEKVAFNICEYKKNFDLIKNVEETADSYLERIPLERKVDVLGPFSKIDDFYVDRQESKKNPHVIKTASQTTGNNFEILNIKHRLNLLMTVPIADISPRGVVEYLGFELRNDKGLKHADYKETKEWLPKSEIIDYIKTGGETSKGRFVRKDEMCVFQTRLFLNLEKDKTYKREIGKGVFNNVIVYENNEYENSYNNDKYSRNYCVGTSRVNVLHPNAASGNDDRFNGTTHFDKYKNLSPTEQVFFTLYALVRTNNAWYDMLSKEPVPNDQLEKIIRIESLGFVKIVLFYELTNKGAAQLKECYIDGLKVKVIPGEFVAV